MAIRSIVTSNGGDSADQNEERRAPRWRDVSMLFTITCLAAYLLMQGGESKARPVPGTLAAPQESFGSSFANEGIVETVEWEVVTRRLRANPPNQPTNLFALPADQPMVWAHQVCAPNSQMAHREGTVPLGPDHLGRWHRMGGAHADCAFSEAGKWLQPLDSVQLVNDAAAYTFIASISNADTATPRTFCTPQDLSRLHDTQFVGTFQSASRRADAVPGDDRHRRQLRNAKLRHPRCELPDPDRPYQWLVMLTAAALERGQPHPIVAFVGDSVHRNMMAAMMAVLRGQRDTVVDRQTHMPARYVLTTHGDYWSTDSHVGAHFGDQHNHNVPGLHGQRVLLELIFGPSFRHGAAQDVPIDLVPGSTPAFPPHLTTLVAGGLLHLEPTCKDRVAGAAALLDWASTLARLAASHGAANQTWILRGSNRALRSDVAQIALPAFHDWKDAVYQEVLTLAAAAHERSGELAGRAGAKVVFLDALETHAHRDQGMQPTHPQLRATDHVHYTCVAHEAMPAPVTEWKWLPWQCRSYRDKALASLVVAMTLARLVRDV
jgi:hypothetical protein